jgi:uncharacterized repeat protein (TIGR01451 family)
LLIKLNSYNSSYTTGAYFWRRYCYGGGIYNTGHLTATACLFTNNEASYGGGIHNTGQLAVVNSTFSGNTAYEGGGIHSTGVMTLTHITLADNTASNANTGGGIRQVGGALYAYNTLIAHSGRGGDCYVDSDSIILANVNNWVADGTCSANGANFRNGDPLLDPLGDNGGDTLTYALPVISPAVDAGDAAFCPPTDQRGKPRSVGAGCDIGAYELGPLHLTYTVTPTADASYHGLVTYTLALANTGDVDEADLWLTATLPAEVIMAGWIVSPSHTTSDSHAVYWHGDLAVGEVVTLTFQAQHTGEYADVVVSEARFTGATDVGRAYNTFTVECAPAYQVTTAADSGLGSLRNALAGTCEGGTISFADDTTIYLSSTLTISRGVTVDGSGHAITVSGDSGNDGSRDVTVFYVTAGNAVTLSHLSIVSGSATLYGYGGGIINMMGNLRLLDSTLTDNQAAVGGAIFNAGALAMTRCTLLNNVAEMGGGILAYGGTLNVQNSTLAYNQASDRGGGVYNYYGNPTFQNSTLSHNTAENDGGGIHNKVGPITLTHTTLSDNTVITGTGVGAGYHQEDEDSTLYAYHTLIANSVVSGTAGGDCVIAGGVISASVNNLIEDGACGATLSGDPALGPLQDNGGGTATRALLSGSPAIDAIPPVSCTLTMDQRGMPRPYPVGGACDIGAYEAYPALSLAKSVTPTTDLAYHGAVTYTLVLSNSGAVTETQAALRDTLPPEVTFGAWIISPTDTLYAGTLHAGNVITWDGELAAGATRTWRFTALHIGDYDEVITNTATFSGAQAGSAAATFSVMLTPTYVITPTWSAGGYITPGAPQAVIHGGSQTFTITPDSHYHIADVWVDGVSVGAQTSYTFSNVTANHVLSAAFALTTHTLAVGIVGQGTVTPTDGIYTEGDVVTLTATADPGWYFGQWSGDASGILTQTTVTLDADKIITATFSQTPPPTYTLDARIDPVEGGSVDIDPDQTSYISGTEVTLTAEPVTGWHFTGWSGHLTGTLNPAQITLDADKIITATFSQTPPPTYTLDARIDPVEGGSVDIDPDQTSYISGTEVTLTAEPVTGWRFTGWTGDLSGTANPAQVTMDADKVITATFVATPPTYYTLTMHLVGSGVITPGVGTHSYLSGTVVNLSASPAAGWQFVGWTGDFTDTLTQTTVTMTGDKVVTATFVATPPTTYTLTMHLVGSGVITPGVGARGYLSGMVVNLSASPDDGWQFDGWSGDLQSTANPVQVTLDADQAITATFSELAPPPSYTLIVDVVGQGHVTRTPSQTTYLAGDVVTLTATPDAGWYFGQWSGGASGTLTQTIITMNAAKVVTATFVETPPTYYALTMQLAGSGVITPDVGAHSYLSGTLVDLSASPAAGWLFTGWSGALSGAANPAQVTLDADKVITATFTESSYLVYLPLVQRE